MSMHRNDWLFSIATLADHLIKEDVGGRKDKAVMRSIADSVTAVAHRMEAKEQHKRGQSTTMSASDLSDMEQSMEAARPGSSYLVDRIDALSAQSNVIDSIGDPESEREFEESLETLPFQDDAKFTSPLHQPKSGFLEGTQTHLLATLESWAADTSSQASLLLLSGAGGTGKSTIAYELAKRLEKQGRLGASFFFSRTHEYLNSTTYVFPTIAYQLACSQPNLRPVITEASHGFTIRDRPDDLERQLDDLIIYPLAAISNYDHPVVVVMDGLDECTDPMLDRISQMLHTLLRKLCELQFPLRFFITTRPELHVQSILTSAEFRANAETIRIQDITPAAMDDDIRQYFAVNLAALPISDRLFSAKPRLVDALTKRAEGLWLYAHTVVRLLRDYPHSCSDIVDCLLPDPPETETLRLPELDQLYTTALEKAFPQYFFDFRRRNKEVVKDVLAAVSLSFDSISPQTIERLFEIPLNTTRSVVDRLQSILSCSEENDRAVRPLHGSLSEFLRDTERCRNTNFHIDAGFYHRRFALHCLGVLATDSHLHHNILGMGDLGIPLHEVVNLPSRIRECIPPYLQYACKHWTDHLIGALPVPELITFAQKFSRTRLFAWLEAMSILGHLKDAEQALSAASKWCQTNADHAVADLLSDVYRLVVHNFNTIEARHGEIYILATKHMTNTASEELHNLLEEEVPQPMKLINAAVRLFPTTPKSQSGLGLPSPSDDMLLVKEDIVKILSSKEQVRNITEYRGQNVASLIELLDYIVAHGDDFNMPTGVINTSFRILKRLCERDHYLPRSCVLPQESITMESPIPIAFGGFGEVFRAEYKTPDGSMDVAVKRYRLTPQKDSQRTRKDFCREVVVWRHLKHRNVGEFLGTHNNTQTRMSLVSKWMPNGSIKNFIKRVPTVNRLQLISGTARGLAYLHSQRVIHGDLKDDNVVVDESGNARLIDFGLTTILHTADTENMITTLHTATGPGIRGTVHWMAPELFNPEAFELKSSMPSAASDIYALALVMWGVFSLQVPFHQYPLSATVIFNVLNGARPPRPERTKELGLSDMLWDFITECWAANPADRPSIDTILNKLHAFDEDRAAVR